MSEYTIVHASGVSYKSSAKTLLGAKREAFKDATFGGGSVSVIGPEGTFSRGFWQSLNLYGWGKWVKTS